MASRNCTSGTFGTSGTPGAPGTSATLIEFISDSFLGDGTRIAADTALLDLNILDSAALFDVVDFIHRQFAIGIPVGEVHPNNFASVRALTQLIERLQSAPQPAEVSR
ncbi:acyl carrier protein [Cupriavidus basilensis]|uniref:Acyl carrier protein n=1 Tax=Cupriavidus basilensis TaxID=68895 RepID=A0ABT6AW87_9BURK|nr:acyl carrier protein [Cupriavidus basilensis]MDF3836623.1 acyl carrier protein [Cupriavidus basilensis]